MIKLIALILSFVVVGSWLLAVSIAFSVAAYQARQEGRHLNVSFWSDSIEFHSFGNGPIMDGDGRPILKNIPNSYGGISWNGTVYLSGCCVLWPIPQW